MASRERIERSWGRRSEGVEASSDCVYKETHNMLTIFRASAILIISSVSFLAGVALADAPPLLVVGMPSDHQPTGEVLYASDVRVPYDYQGQAPSPPWSFVLVQRSEKPAATAYNPNPAWGAWVSLGISAKVAVASGFEFVDTTLPSLTSEYKYRMQNCILAIYNSYYCDPTWSTWSPEPNGYGARAECEGQPTLAPPRLVVAWCDYDGQPECTGRDLAIALYYCGLGNHKCTLQALPATYTDVNILIDDQTHPFLGGSCSQWGDHTQCIGNDLVLNKVVIEGQAGATVFQGKAYQQPEVPAPVFMIANRPEIRVRFRNLTIDGNKEAFTNLPPPRSAWQGDGIVIRHDRTGPPTLASNQNSCLTNLKIRNVLTRGVFLADASNAMVEHSRVENVGCYGFTSDPDALAPCQDVTAGGPDPDLQNFPGVQMEGVGLAFGGNFLPDPTLDPTWGLTLRRNDVSRASSVGISIKAGANGYQEISSGVSILENWVHDSGPVLLAVGGVRGIQTAPSTIEHNLLESNTASEIGDAILTDDPAVELDGHISALTFSNNTIRNTYGMALLVTATDLEYVDAYGTPEGGPTGRIPSTGFPTGRRTLLQDNVITNTCVGKSFDQEYRKSSIQFTRTTGVYRLQSNALTGSQCDGLLDFDRASGELSSNGQPEPLYYEPALGLILENNSFASAACLDPFHPLASFTGLNRDNEYDSTGLRLGVFLHLVNHFDGAFPCTTTDRPGLAFDLDPATNGSIPQENLGQVKGEVGAYPGAPGCTLITEVDPLLHFSGSSWFNGTAPTPCGGFF